MLPAMYFLGMRRNCYTIYEYGDAFISIFLQNYVRCKPLDSQHLSTARAMSVPKRKQIPRFHFCLLPIVGVHTTQLPSTRIWTTAPARTTASSSLKYAIFLQDGHTWDALPCNIVRSIRDVSDSRLLLHPWTMSRSAWDEKSYGRMPLDKS